MPTNETAIAIQSCLIFDEKPTRGQCSFQTAQSSAYKSKKYAELMNA